MTETRRLRAALEAVRNEPLPLENPTRSPDWNSGWTEGYLAGRSKFVAELSALLSEPQAAQESADCATCHGRRWVMKSSYQDLGNGIASGGSWNEPCPDCAASSSDEQAEKKL